MKNKQHKIHPARERRDIRIRKEFIRFQQTGKKVDDILLELATKFFLSPERIRSIVYRGN